MVDIVNNISGKGSDNPLMVLLGVLQSIRKKRGKSSRFLGVFGLFLVFTGVFVGLALNRSSMRRRSIMAAGSLFFWPVVNRGKEGGQRCSHRTRGGVLVAPIDRKGGRREAVASLFSPGINTPRVCF